MHPRILRGRYQVQFRVQEVCVGADGDQLPAKVDVDILLFDRVDQECSLVRLYWLIDPVVLWQRITKIKSSYYQALPVIIGRTSLKMSKTNN